MEQPEKNFSLLTPLIEQAAEMEFPIVLSELFSNGFSMNTNTLVCLRWPQHPISTEQATELGIWICGSVPILSKGNDPHNSLVLADPDGNT